MRKALVILSILAVLFVVGTCAIQLVQKNDKPGTTAAMDTMPSVAEAPWIVQTTSRIYYAKSAQVQKDKSVVMSDYWTLEDGKWKYIRGKVTLDSKYGKVTVVKR